jgi:hypothetical protein
VVSNVVGVPRIKANQGIEIQNPTYISLRALMHEVGELAGEKRHSVVTCVHFAWVLIKRFPSQAKTVLTAVRELASNSDSGARGSSERLRSEKAALLLAFDYIVGDLEVYLNSEYFPFSQAEYVRFKDKESDRDPKYNSVFQGFLAHAILEGRYTDLSKEG